MPATVARLLVPALLLSGLVSPLQAQMDGPSILTLLPVEAELSVGSEHVGTLGSEHVMTTMGQRVAAFTVEGHAGDPLSVDLRSTDFDAYLYLIGPDLAPVEEDDDSGGACNARLATFLPAAGTYRIVVGSLGGETGSYELVVGQRALPEARGECGGDPATGASIAGTEPSGTLALGAAVDGSLGEGDATLPDGGWFKTYTYDVAAGETFTVDLTSSAFDSLLRIATADGLVLATDDDGGGACNSRITHTADEDGALILVVGTLLSGGGPFRLRVSEQPGPTNPGPCNP